jgi:hypothetical protein
VGQKLPIDDGLADEEPRDMAVCEGRPHCMLHADAVVKNQRDGCPRCRRYRRNPDGTTTEYRLRVH